MTVQQESLQKLFCHCTAGDIGSVDHRELVQSIKTILTHFIP